MKPLQHLWPALESVPGLRAVQAEWKHRLRSEFDSLQQCLIVTNDVATSYPAPELGEPRPIVAHGSDEFAAICPLGGGSISLRRNDVLVRRFDGTRLARAIGVALEASLAIEAVSGAGAAWRIGLLPLALGAQPIFFAMPADESSLTAMIDAIAARCRHPYLLLAPTRRLVTANVEARLVSTGGCFFPTCELIYLDDNGQFGSPASALQMLATVLGVEPVGGAAGYIFRKDGDKWVVSYEGTTVYPNHSVGMFYLSRLLAEPNQGMPVALLESARSGLDPRVASGSSGEVLTYETRANYQSRRSEIEEEIDEARDANDFAKVEQLQSDDELLKKQLASAIGLGGRQRQNSEMEKARKRVREAISRAVEKLSNQHEQLGRHLTQCVETGLVCTYKCEPAPHWLT